MMTEPTTEVLGCERSHRTGGYRVSFTDGTVDMGGVSIESPAAMRAAADCEWAIALDAVKRAARLRALAEHVETEERREAERVAEARKRDRAARRAFREANRPAWMN